LAVDDTVDGKDNKMEKTREDVSHQLKFFQIEPDMLWFFILSTCLTILSTCELVVDSTVDGKGNKEEKTREVANIRMYHFCRNFFQLGCDICGELVMVVDKKVVFSFNDI